MVVHRIVRLFHSRLSLDTSKYRRWNHNRKY